MIVPFNSNGSVNSNQINDPASAMLQMFQTMQKGDDLAAEKQTERDMHVQQLLGSQEETIAQLIKENAALKAMLAASDHRNTITAAALEAEITALKTTINSAAQTKEAVENNYKREIEALQNQIQALIASKNEFQGKLEQQQPVIDIIKDIHALYMRLERLILQLNANPVLEFEIDPLREEIFSLLYTAFSKLDLLRI